MAYIKTERILSSPAIAIDRAGKGDLLVLMHGIGGNRTNWTEQVEVFSEHFHTVSWDARGYGDSDDYEGPLEFSDFARDLEALLDHFGAKNAHLCGLSMGGRIAQDFYLQFPERVKTLTLVATFSGFRNFSSEERQRFINLRKKPLVEEGKEPRDIAPTVAKTLIGPTTSEDKFRRLVHSMEKLHKDSYVKTIEASTMYDRTLELETVRVPTCLIFGEHDSLTTPQTGQAMAERIKGSEFHVVPRSGHLINIEEPEIFNQIVLEFLLRDKR